MRAELTRDELVRRLAEVSHKTWIKQKVRDQGGVEADLSLEVSEHDLERAEDAVQELERLGVAALSAESVALILSCAECRAVWLPVDEERWAAYLTDDEPPEVVFYCPRCAEREFGED